jgi:hypothetical protein
MLSSKHSSSSAKIPKCFSFHIFRNMILKFVLIFYSAVYSEEKGNWCEGEKERSYEVIVSPRLIDSVPCLELYRSVHDAWLYDENRMQEEHGGES